jgi:hypothetical protein
MAACNGSTIRRRDKGERHQPPDVAADASALRDFHQRCCPTRNRIIKPPRECAIALSGAGSALGGGELLTGMMSFNPTARRLEEATNVQSAVIGIVASRGDQGANFRWSRDTACVGRNVGGIEL